MKKIHYLFLIIIIFSGCATNPVTGQRNMAFISNNQLFSMSFASYQEFLSENTIVTGTPEAEMIVRVGNRLVEAAQRLLASQGNPNFMNDFQWEFTLVQDNTVNAWVMPGGKVVFYTGILPVTQNEDGIAVVMGHEIAHAILNHGQQRMSAGLLQQIGMLGLAVGTSGFSVEAQAGIMMAFGVGTNLFGALPFSRAHEREADEYGLILMAIAGYNLNEAPAFWERIMAISGGGTPQFLSTHPSPPNRARDLQNFIPEAQRRAAQIGVLPRR
jgi:predicted Zn-dependent protease